MGSDTSKAIPDNFKTIQEVQKAVREAGLESSSLIFGIDYTGSNQSTGQKSFQGRNLHDCTVLNPYQEVIQILGETLEPFDDDHIIPTYGFGDKQTGDKSVFPFYPNKEPVGFKEVLERYKEITPKIELYGPTSFKPLIYEAIKIVKERRAYHILVIVTDGQVSDENENIRAIVEASKYALSIICIGVGDGPFDSMEKFDDKIKGRKFDNFQFVQFNVIRKKYCEDFAPAFATACLQEVPKQFKLIKKLEYLG
ncbi:MAG: putative E3 ubiquitin-protein ligase RGLG4 [Streblomastix strix]|uniref:Putative E3 ubiquitin-protein ligase RGLG4 n=1 Tax=Streblomastix strix TaxID=222440 RepID=A0A5J4W153_9EUKA|nr:MAG: putative E3 ubiquitin-protein ligase RGLG4 [Streblomastix strix]